MSEGGGGDDGGRDHDKRCSSPVRRNNVCQNPQDSDDDVLFIGFDMLGEDGGAPVALRFSRQREKVFSSDTTSESYSEFSAHTCGTDEDGDGPIARVLQPPLIPRSPFHFSRLDEVSNPADVRQLLLQGRARARQQYQQLHGTVHVPSQQPQAKPAPSAAAGAAVSAVHCLSPDRSASSSSSSGKGKSNGSSRSGSGAGKPKLTPRRDSSNSRRSAASSSGTIMPSGQPLTVEQHDTMTEQERRAIAEEVLRRAGGSEAFLRSIMEQRKKEGLL
jgi:hypothetical protein